MPGAVCVDFDGVIHSYVSGWQGPGVIPDPPVPGAIEWLNEIGTRYVVVILTTRAASPDGVRAVRRWLRERGHLDWEGVAVTDRKPPAVLDVDDRAGRFEGAFPTQDEIRTFRPWRSD
jgi:hypothetical protein